MNKIKNNKYNFLTIILKYSFVFVIFASLIMPFVFIKAQDVTGGNGGVDADTGRVIVNTGINNPLPKIETLPDFIEAIIDIILLIGVPIVTLAIIYSGFLFVSAQGNTEKLKTAKKTLLYTLIGAALILGAFVLAEAIVETVEEIKK